MTCVTFVQENKPWICPLYALNCHLKSPPLLPPLIKTLTYWPIPRFLPLMSCSKWRNCESCTRPFPCRNWSRDTTSHKSLQSLAIIISAHLWAAETGHGGQSRPTDLHQHSSRFCNCEVPPERTEEEGYWMACRVYFTRGAPSESVGRRELDFIFFRQKWAASNDHPRSHLPELQHPNGEHYIEMTFQVTYIPLSRRRQWTQPN